MEGYKATIAYTSKELTAREKIRIIQANNAVPIDASVEPDKPLVIDYDYHVVVEVHNEKAKGDKDYIQVFVVDKAGTMYKSGSRSLIESMEECVSLMHEAGEKDIPLEISMSPSKNYTGKYFLTCTVA